MCFRELTTNENLTTYRASKISFLDKTTVAFGGTFLESEVNELRSFGKAIFVSAALIPYWMIYSQVVHFVYCNYTTGKLRHAYKSFQGLEKLMGALFCHGHLMIS